VLPARRPPVPPAIARAVPSLRSVLVGLALLVLGVGTYVAARETSLFAVRALEIQGGTPVLRAQVRKALRDEMGQSLLKVDGQSLERRIAPLSGVRAFEYDRAFPNTLRIVVRPEKPVLVLRQGAAAFVVSTTGRVIRPLAHRRRSHLPRLYVTHGVRIRIGSRLPHPLAAAATTLAPLRSSPPPGGIRSIRVGRELTLVLGGGLELRLGDRGDLALKVAIARRILRSAGDSVAGGGYIDVSVPERPVLSLKSQVAG
jgi:cell division protein FtsQ